MTIFRDVDFRDVVYWVILVVGKQLDLDDLTSLF